MRGRGLGRLAIKTHFPQQHYCLTTATSNQAEQKGKAEALGWNLMDQILQAVLGMCHVLWSTNMSAALKQSFHFQWGILYVSSFNHGPFSIANWPFICPVRLRPTKKRKLNGTSFCKPNLHKLSAILALKKWWKQETVQLLLEQKAYSKGFW